MTQGAVQAAGTGSSNSITDLPTTTRGTRVPAATSAPTILVKAGQGEVGRSTTTCGGG